MPPVLPNSALVLVFVYLALIALALIVGVSSPRLRDSVVRRRLGYVQEIYESGIGVAVGLVYAMIALLSLPAGILFGLWVKDRRKEAMRARIDLWVLIWFAITMVLLLSGVTGVLWLLAILPVMRIADITYTLLFVVVFPGQSTSPSTARPLILLLIHLLEITISFAVFYQVAYAACNLKVDGAVCRYTGSLPGLDALYFSLVTAATVGYGDIVPLSSARWITVSQILLSLFLTLISIPRVINNYPARPSGNPPP